MTTTAPAAPSADRDVAGVRLGDVVLYSVTSADVDRLTRDPVRMFGIGTAGQRNPYASSGTDVGAILPALVTAVWGPEVAKLTVYSDCPGGALWCPSRTRGDGPGCWRWRDE